MCGRPDWRRGLARDRLTWIGIEGDGKVVPEPSQLGAALAAMTSLRGLGWSTGCRPQHLPDPLPRAYGPFLASVVGRIAWFQVICATNTWLVATGERSADGTLRPLLARLGYADAPMWLCHLLIGLGLGQAAWSGLEARQSDLRVADLRSWAMPARRSSPSSAPSSCAQSCRRRSDRRRSTRGCGRR